MSDFSQKLEATINNIKEDGSQLSRDIIEGEKIKNNKQYEYHIFSLIKNDVSDLNKLGKDGWLIVSEVRKSSKDDVYTALFVREIKKIT